VLLSVGDEHVENPACSAYIQLPLLFRQTLRICAGDRCSAARYAALKESDAGGSRMCGGYRYGKRKLSL